MDIFSRLYKLLHGKKVIVAGNGKSLSLFQNTHDSIIATVNAGLQFFAKQKIPVDIYWVQDRRMLIDKQDMVKSFLNDVRYIIFNKEISYFHRRRKENLLPLRMLGYSGFSHDIRVGVFHGYTAICGLLQILTFFEVSSIELYGVGMDYFYNEPRFYQKKRGIDTDLNRAADQVILMRKALDIIQQKNITITIAGDSMLKSTACSF